MKIIFEFDTLAQIDEFCSRFGTGVPAIITAAEPAKKKEPKAVTPLKIVESSVDSSTTAIETEASKIAPTAEQKAVAVKARELVTELSLNGKKAPAKELLKSFGATGVTNLEETQPGKLIEFYEKLQAL